MLALGNWCVGGRLRLEIKALADACAWKLMRWRTLALGN